MARRALAVGAAALAGIAVSAVQPGEARAPGVTITMWPDTVVYGGASRVAGRVSPQATNDPVVLEVRLHGTASFKPVATVEPAGDGRWHYRVEPTVESLFRAQHGSLQSRIARVRVRPRVTLRYVRGVFAVRVVAARSFRGRKVLFQRRGESGWRTLRTVVVRERPTRFRVHFARPARVRAHLPRRATLPGYLAGWSRAVTVSR